MSIESGLKFTPEQPNRSEVSQAERDLNEIIPILAHGLVRRIEQKGFSGKVRVQALAGDTWGVAKSPENPTDVPNVIVYPRESLAGDRRLVNARLRHEIGNLNYPIDSELNDLRGWCYENGVAPELLTSLVEATHEASVNYLEMQNSHSSNPEDNFRALYEQEINTEQIADGIPQSAPYKQAVDIALLYSLSQTGIVPADQVEHALAGAHPEVQEIFDKQTRSVLDQSVKMAVPKKQVQLIRDFLWPKFSKLVALSGPAHEESGTETHDKKAQELLKEVGRDMSPEATVRAQQAKELQERIKQMMEKMRQDQRKPQTGKKPPQQSEQRKQQKESARKPEQKLSAAEQQERKEEENLLAQNLQEQLDRAKEQMEKMGQKTPEAQKPQETPSLEDIAKQAEQMREQAQKAMQEAKEAGVQDEITEEQLQQLKEQLEQLEEVAKQIAESGEFEEELAKPEEEPIVYNIKEYGINEADLTPEQLEHLEKVRDFAQNTSKVYRTAMRLLMKGYQQYNPNFTDKMMQKMMERGYDVPDFSIYGSQAAADFFAQQQELGVDGFSDNFMVNFQLPKPLARFWYKGGSGSKSVPVKEGEIEWGHFYRMCMPIIYSGVDRAGMKGLYLNRLNQFGQHDPKKYYYLWETVNLAEQKEEDLLKAIQEQLQEMKEQLNDMDEQSGNKDGQQSDQSKSKSADQESGQSGKQEQSDQNSENTPSAEQLKQDINEMHDQVEQMMQDAKESGDEAKAEQLQEMKDKLDQMAEQLEQAEQGQENESSEQGEGQESGQSQQGSESQQGEGSDSGEGENGEGQGEGAGEGGQPGGQGGEMGDGSGMPGGMESGAGGMPSAQDMQEMLSQMQDMLNDAKQGGGSGQEAIDQMLEQLSQMQQSLESGASPQDMAGQMQEAMQQLSEMMEGMQGEGQRGFGEQEISTDKQSGGQIYDQGFEKSKIENTSSQHDPNQRGGAGNTIEGEGVTFSRPDPSLLAQLRNGETLLGSKFTQQDEDGNFKEKEIDQEQVAHISQEQLDEIERKSAEQLSRLDQLKLEHQRKTEALYREMSGLDGEALRLYVDYMETTKDLTDDLTDFFIEKFDLDRDQVYERNQRRGARLQRGYSKNILGTKEGRPVLSPRSFERKRPPEMPQFVWTVILDNTGSVGGMIEDEKKLMVSLMEVTKRLDIPFEVVIYTEGGYQFLKTFDQEAYGEDLQKAVLLQATIGNQQDTDLLRAAYTSQTRFSDKFKRSNNFIFFLTDGLACSTDSLNDLVNKFKKETVIVGVGLAQGAATIKKEFGRNAVEVQDARQLSTKFIRKVEELVDQTFD